MARPDSPNSVIKSYALDEPEYDETLDDADNPLVRAPSGLPLLDTDVLNLLLELAPMAQDLYSITYGSSRVLG